MKLTTHKLTVYKGTDGWRWRLQARNGKIVADSAEAYARKRNAEKAALSLLNATIELIVEPTPPQKLVRVRGKFASVTKTKGRA